MTARPAARYSFVGDGVSGWFTPGSRWRFRRPRAALAIDGRDAAAVSVSPDPAGWVLTGLLDLIPDLLTRTVSVTFPMVLVDDEPEPFQAFLSVEVFRINVAGVPQPSQPGDHDERPLTGTAER